MLTCNCSICRRNRFWPAIVTPDRFRLLAGEEIRQRVIYVPTKLVTSSNAAE